MQVYLRYAGNKSWLKDWFIEKRVKARFLTKRRLVSPFCGALGDVFQLLPDHALLNDSYSPLVNLHSQIRSGLEITIPCFYDKDLYKERVEIFNSLTSDRAIGGRFAYLKNPEQANLAAQILYYLNRTGFNGLFRTAKNGAWNTPVGTPNKYRQEFKEYSQHMNNWVFSCGDFQNLSVNSDDFLMLDPPYDPYSSTSNFTNYGTGKFSWGDQIRLLNWAIAAKVPFILCNNATPRIVEVYSSVGLKLDFVDKKRSINSKASERKTPVREVIAYNF